MSTSHLQGITKWVTLLCKKQISLKSLNQLRTITKDASAPPFPSLWVRGPKCRLHSFAVGWLRAAVVMSHNLWQWAFWVYCCVWAVFLITCMAKRERDRQTDRESGTKRERETDRQTDRQRDWHGERDRQTDWHRQRKRERERAPPNYSAAEMQTYFTTYLLKSQSVLHFRSKSLEERMHTHKGLGWRGGGSSWSKHHRHTFVKIPTKWKMFGRVRNLILPSTPVSKLSKKKSIDLADE